MKDTQPYTALKTSEADKRKKVAKALRESMSKTMKNDTDSRQIEMSGDGFKSKKKKKERVSVWTIGGSRKWNGLRYRLHELIMDGKSQGMSDVEAFCYFADDEETQNLIKEHINEEVRTYSRDKLIESARQRMRQDLLAMLKDDAISAKTPEELPSVYPVSVLMDVKRNPLQEAFVRAKTLSDRK